MINLDYPKGSLVFLDNALILLTEINKRTMPIEEIHKTLDDMGEGLKKMINHRKKYLKEENLSVINLSTIVHSKLLDINNKILIKVNDIVFPINIAYGVEIQNNFNAYDYSINKIGSTQELHYAHYEDALLHKTVTQYNLTYGNYKYKVGNRIELKPYGGSYKIVYIDAFEAIITCKKWQQEGKKNRRIKVSDIKCLASNDLNSLNFGKTRI